MMELVRKHLSIIAWTLVGVTCLAAVIIWGQLIGWQSSSLSDYTIFPLLGLLAFSIMWSQYAAGSLRRLAGIDKPALARFSTITGFAVTTAILLHPSLLIWQLWRDGAGLPPGSYLHFVKPTLEWAILLGTASLFVFLAYELRHRFGGRSWWHYVDYLNDAAIIAIYVHGFNLGSHTMYKWFMPLWIFYGIGLAVFLLHKHFSQSKRHGWIMAGVLVLALVASGLAMKASADQTPANSSQTAPSANVAPESAPASTEPGSPASGSTVAPPSAPSTTPVSPVANQAANTITIKADGFSPATITVKKGSPVVWQNSDSSQHAIDPAAGSSGPHSPPLKQGESYTYTFKDKGQYKYIDVMAPDHGGSVTVTD
jgi:plastocyanin